MKSITVVAGAALLAGAAFVIFVPTWEHVPARATEVGFPQEIQFSRDSEFLPVNQAPPPLPAVAQNGPLATSVYKNVQVLTDVSAAEFMRTQEAITQWVSPKQGCDFCHTGTDYASDDKPAKTAARIMMRMTRHMNADWKEHLAAAGVTCYSCHRGEPFPAEAWIPQAPKPQRPWIAKSENWQESADTVRKFFPDAGWAEYYLQNEPIAVQSTTALPGRTIHTYAETVRIYEMMMQQSDGIGVNCGYCHNSRAFESWDESTPYRWNGYSGIQMTRDLDRNFLMQLDVAVPQSRQLINETNLPVLPAQQSGVQPGNGLVVCKTCHYGLPKPLNGANMAHDYPALTPAAAR